LPETNICIGFRYQNCEQGPEQASVNVFDRETGRYEVGFSRTLLTDSIDFDFIMKGASDESTLDIVNAPNDDTEPKVPYISVLAMGRFQDPSAMANTTVCSSLNRDGRPVITIRVTTYLGAIFKCYALTSIL
jgi:hypothetical protein